MRIIVSDKKTEKIRNPYILILSIRGLRINPIKENKSKT